MGNRSIRRGEDSFFELREFNFLGILSFRAFSISSVYVYAAVLWPLFSAASLPLVLISRLSFPLSGSTFTFSLSFIPSAFSLPLYLHYLYFYLLFVIRETQQCHLSAAKSRSSCSYSSASYSSLPFQIVDSRKLSCSFCCYLATPSSPLAPHSYSVVYLHYSFTPYFINLLCLLRNNFYSLLNKLNK